MYVGCICRGVAFIWALTVILFLLYSVKCATAESCFILWTQNYVVHKTLPSIKNCVCTQREYACSLSAWDSWHDCRMSSKIVCAHHFSQTETMFEGGSRGPAHTDIANSNHTYSDNQRLNTVQWTRLSLKFPSYVLSCAAIMDKHTVHSIYIYIFFCYAQV